MSRGTWKSSSSPESRGVQWSNTVGSTLWGMASDVAVVLDIVLGLAEIALAFCQPLQMAWWRFVGPASQGPAYSSGGILRALQVKVLCAPAVAGHAAVPDCNVLKNSPNKSHANFFFQNSFLSLSSITS